MILDLLKKKKLVGYCLCCYKEVKWTLLSLVDSNILGTKKEKKEIRKKKKFIYATRLKYIQKMFSFLKICIQNLVKKTANGLIGNSLEIFFFYIFSWSLCVCFNLLIYVSR